MRKKRKQDNRLYCPYCGRQAVLRPILVSVEFKIPSYTRLASDLKENHLHTIISSFYVGNTPGVSTFYDFHRRLWFSSDKSLTNAVHPLQIFAFHISSSL